MKNLLISTALLTTPFVGSVSAQTTTSTLTNLVSEQERQIQELKTEVSSLRSLLNLERRKNGKASLPASTSYSSSTAHTVKSGDTFSSISKKYGVSVNSLIKANPKVKPSNMKLDHKLIIPRSSSKTIASAPKKASISSNSSQTISTSSGSYKVTKGDTFYKIARNHGMSLAALSAANPGLNPNKLQIGQTVRLSKSTSKARTAKSLTKPKAKVKTKAVKTSQPTNRAYKPLPKVVEKPPAPTVKPVQKVVEVAPIPTPAPDPTESYVNQSGKIARTVPVSHEMTYGAFAQQHGTSIKVLNTLNGLDLPADEPMAAGSELFIPIR